jgi:hypothetical protein
MSRHAAAKMTSSLLVELGAAGKGRGQVLQIAKCRNAEPDPQFLKILVGLPSIAVDRHLRAFIVSAGIEYRGYDEAKALFLQVADRLSIDSAALDGLLSAAMSTVRQHDRITDTGRAQRTP